MTELGRSWINGTNFRPAREVEIKYGSGLIKSESDKSHLIDITILMYFGWLLSG